MHSTTKNISSTDVPGSAAMGSAGRRILIAAGGTGGHVYPAIAIADALRKQQPEVDILFVGTRDHMEWREVPRAGYPIRNIWISGFHRRLTLKNLLFPVKLVTSIFQSYAILSDYRPEVVIACGGYVSGPIGWMAAKRKIPLVLQEQNSYPGVTNRLLARHADTVFTAFKEADRYLPEGKTRLTGNPVRHQIAQADKKKSYGAFQFKQDTPTLLVLGGSGGARSINVAMSSHIKYLHDKLGLQIIWQCGPRYYDGIKTRIDTGQLQRLRLLDYIDNMPEAYAAADLVISRAGALSCSELALTGKPSILIPSPHVAGDHQTKNALSMVDEGAARMLRDEQLNQKLADSIEELIFDRETLQDMSEAAVRISRPDAARDIAAQVFRIKNSEEQS